MKTHIVSATMVLVILAHPACSVYKAATQPPPADLTGIGVGMPRTQVITRLGPPKFSDTDQQGNKHDTFEFDSGLHSASKARVIPYLAADFFTLALAELVLWPMELTVLERAKCIAVVTYDPLHKIETFNVTQKDGLQAC